MGKSTKLLKIKELRNRSDVGTFLHQLAEKIEGGTVVLSQGEREITLEIPNSLRFELEVQDKDTKRKGVKHSLELELKWFEGDNAGGPLEVK
jgi:amphi-Trp domain-containing protein